MPLAEAPPRRLIQIFPRSSVPEQKLVCPCEFDLGKHIDGETVLIIDHNGEGQPAFVNIDGAILRIANTAPFKFSCAAKDRVDASWESSGVKLSIVLTTDGPGEESCWFRGEMAAQKGRRTETRKIVGACGC